MPIKIQAASPLNVIIMSQLKRFTYILFHKTFLARCCLLLLVKFVINIVFVGLLVLLLVFGPCACKIVGQRKSCPLASIMQEQEVARSAPEYIVCLIYIFSRQLTRQLLGVLTNKSILAGNLKKMVIIKASCHQSAVTVHQSRVT